MAVIVDWIDEPHIFQFTIQGRNSVDDILMGWDEIGILYRAANNPKPFCGLGVILPDREVPIGILKVVTHPATQVMKTLDAAAITGVDHYLFGMLVELLSRIDGVPTIHTMETHDEALRFLRQVVRARLDGVI